MNNAGKSKFDRKLIYIAAFILITAVSLVYKLFLNGSFDGFLLRREKTGDIVVETAENTAASSSAVFVTEEAETQVNSISVYICGSVRNPGVYELDRGSIINDAVLMAGGFTADAQADRVNLVYIMNSNISIYIPGDGDEYESNEILRDENQTLWGESGIGDAGNTGGTININTASRETLMELPGIGEATADAIISYREETSFASIEDIMNVSGIGEAKFNRIRDLICV